MCKRSCLFFVQSTLLLYIFPKHIFLPSITKVLKVYIKSLYPSHFLQYTMNVQTEQQLQFPFLGSCILSTGYLKVNSHRCYSKIMLLLYFLRIMQVSLQYTRHKFRYWMKSNSPTFKICVYSVKDYSTYFFKAANEKNRYYAGKNVWLYFARLFGLNSNSVEVNLILLHLPGRCEINTISEVGSLNECWGTHCLYLYINIITMCSNKVKQEIVSRI